MKTIGRSAFRSILAATTAIYLTAPAFADGAASSATPPVEKITVTGSIIDGNKIDSFGSMSTIVTDEQIKDLNALDLSSALRRTPGVAVSRFNPVGSFGGDEGGAVYIRGFGASRPGSEIKTYIDGVPFYMGVWSHPLLDLLPVNGMDRVTVYKGPQPQEFGNNFASVNLTPRKGHGAGADGNIRLAGGSFDTFVEQADVSGRSGKFDYMLAQGYATSQGHREDADGTLVNAMANLGYEIDGNWSLGGTVIYADNDVSDPGQLGLPATKTGQFETRGVFGAAKLSHDFQDFHGTLQLYSNAGEGRWLNQPGLDGDTLSKFSLSGVRWREEYKPWSGGLFAGGIDFDVIDGEVDFNRVLPAPSQHFDGSAVRILSPHIAFSQEMPIGNGWTLVPSAGVRLYNHNVLDGETAPHAGLQLQSDLVSFRVNYARGVNYPGLDAEVLSSLIVALGDSWKSLNAEIDDHYEAGASITPSETTKIDVALFKDQLKGRYIFAFPPTVSAPSFINLGAYDVQGLEASIQQQIGSNWSLFAGITLLDPSLATLPYAPETSFSFGTTFVQDRWRISVDAQHQTGMYVLNEARADGALNTQKVDDFTVANFRVAYAVPELNEKSEVYVAVENLFDATYEYRPGYPMPGTSAQFGVNIGF